MVKAIIIDDELNSRELLQNMLENFCSGVQVEGLGVDVETGIELIRQTEPDLVFLDVEMPGGDGFAVLDAFPEPDFKVIFVTGFSPKAYRHYELASLAWVEKPVDLEDLQAAVEKSGLMPATAQVQLEVARNAMEGKQVQELILPSGGGYERIEFQEVAYLEAHRAYAAFHLVSGEEKLASFSLSHYEKLLPKNLYFRIHKSYLINVQMVKGFESGRGGNLTLKNGVKLPIATRRKADFVKFMKQRAKIG